MADPYEATDALLEDRPDLRDALEELVELDEGGPWAFDDASIDSGPFGEIVSYGIVEKDDGEYRLADREATAAALRGEPKPSDDSTSGFELPNVRARIEAVNRDLVVALVGAFAFLFAFRMTTWRSVFRDGNVVLPANDPYHYRYWVDQILANSDGPFDFSYVMDLPERAAIGEPLVYVIGWWFTALLESTDETGVVIALLPVACALIVGVFVYLMALWVTEDERIGVISVLAFALIPAHALYSGLGFFDHHAFDYMWLAAAATGLVWLARDVELRMDGRRGSGDPVRGHLLYPVTWVVVGLLGVVFAAMMLTWNGAPLLLIGVGVYATVRATSDVRAGHSPLLTAAPLAVALVLGSVLALGPHRFAGWQEPTVVYSPLYVAVGVVGVSAVGEVVRRAGLGPEVHLGAAVVAAPVGILGFREVRPGSFARFAERFGDHLLGREGIAETQPLFRGQIGIVLDPVDQFGWLVFLVLAVLVWATYRCVAEHEPRWLVVCSYSWSFVALILLQIRFAGEFSPFAAVLAGTGLVYLLSVLDLAREPTVFGSRRDRLRFSIHVGELDAREAGYVGFVVLMVASLSLFMVPAAMSNAATTEEKYEVAMWISEHAQTQDGEDYVLSPWGDNRMYNYHVSGESDRYGFAERNYAPFVYSASADNQDRIKDRVGYLTIHEHDGDLPPESVYVRLFKEHGSAQADVDGLGYYRLVHVSSEGSIKVFEVVLGATITGNATADSVTVETDAEVLDESFTYERRAEPEDDTFSITVAYPGTYDVDGTTVEVTEEDVRNGTTIEM